MMKKVVYFLSFLFVTDSMADISAFIDLLSSQRPIAVEVPYCAPVDDSLSYFETDELKIGPQKVNCTPPLEDRWLYSRIHQAHCASRFGETGFTCAESDQAKISARMNNPELMNKITSYTEKTFLSYRDYLAPKCCGDKANCLERFKSVQFEIKQASNLRAEYVSDTIARNSRNNKINITTAKLASAYNTENIDRVLFAELGHACQFALLSEDESLYTKFTHPNTRCDKESGLLMFKEGLGEELASCLIDEVESQIRELPQDQRSKFCFGKWYREVFSDMKFRDQYSSIYHWTYDMGRRSQHTDYASAFKTLKCAMPADLKAQVCGKP